MLVESTSFPKIPGDYSTTLVFEGDPTTLFDDGTRVYRDETSLF
jgi:hypothetical protein